MTRSALRLIVLRLSDSFSALWPALASEGNLELEMTESPGRFATARDALGVIAAGGEEHRLEGALRDLSMREIDAAAVGASVERRVAVAVLKAGAADYFSLTDDLELLRS